MTSSVASAAASAPPAAAGAKASSSGSHRKRLPVTDDLGGVPQLRVVVGPARRGAAAAVLFSAPVQDAAQRSAPQYIFSAERYVGWTGLVARFEKNGTRHRVSGAPADDVESTSIRCRRAGA